MKVWRSRTKYFVECEHCSSRGTTHVPTFMRQTPEMTRAVTDFRARAMSLRDSAQADINKIIHDTQARLQSARSREDQTKLRREGSEQVRLRYQQHVAAVLTLQSSAPKFEPQPEVARACPWCGHAEEVVVTQLPDGARDPWQTVKR